MSWTYVSFTYPPTFPANRAFVSMVGEYFLITLL